jgi:uncharacterized protein YkwD
MATKRATKDVAKEDTSLTCAFGAECGKQLLALTNGERQLLPELQERPALVWNDICFEHALAAAHENAQTGLNGYGNKAAMKAALKACHSNFAGTFRVTTQTIDLTEGGSTPEAFHNFQNSPGHWGYMMDGRAVQAGFAAAKKGDTVYWVGILLKLR